MILPLSILGLGLAACQGDTDPATNIGANSAQLNGTGKCTDANGEHGEFFFQYRPVSTTPWIGGPHHRFDCGGPTSDVNLTEQVTDLEDDTTYEFRVGVDFDPQASGDQVDAWADSQGTPNGSNYDTFKTLALAIPKGGASGFGQAADFYDSVGVNVHFLYQDTSYANYTQVINDLAALGVRHIRDAMYASWYDFRFQYGRPALLAIDQRNQNLPAGEQPIFLTAMTTGWGPNRFDGLNTSYTLDDWFQAMDGGHQHYDGQAGPNADIPGVGNAIPNGTTSNPNAAIPNPWNFNDAEVPWAVYGGITGPNEPGGDHQEDMKPWLQGLLTRKRARTQTVLGGKPYVTKDGIQSGPAKVSQLPLLGIALNNGFIPTYGDWSKGTNVVDVGDRHPYHHFEPNWENVSDNLNDISPYTGRLSWSDPPADPAKALPYMFTEMGYIDRGTDQASLPAHGAGYWPMPGDVAAEYYVRMFLLYYRRGVRRTYAYELRDEHNTGNSEDNFGLVDWDGTKKQSFYAIRNLLKIVGFSEAPQAQKTSINVSVTGFTAGPNNQHTVAFPDASHQLGDVYYQDADRLDTLQLQQSANTYLLFIWGQASLWNREPGNKNPSTGALESLADEAAGRRTPNTQNLTVHLPAGVQSVSVAQPTAGGATTPNDGQAFTPLTISNGTVPLPMSGKTKVLKITMTP